MKGKIFILVLIILLAVLVACKEQEESKIWEVSPTFHIPVTFNDGTEGEYLLIGEEEKAGFLVGSGEKGEAVARPIIANRGNKYMWHFGGADDDITGDFKVVGVNEEGEEHPVLLSGLDETVWEYPGISLSPNNGADSHTPSGMKFPSSGLWKLKVHFDEELFAEVTVDVEEG
ncbi:hypothetical protein CEY16_11510 [Halalkalibacillus sediminis]|uniref:DUF4871 domain-containing protein n=1 Tax=Halalkalibacillus sediminis TaxID=2018042 RepID=A0A2I0QSN1_9BACI|nr:DUF4871 domain-containing protein [Halalkalibacillus sediminis]PKR77352.1 hypothetical protein CEY16_11510 [Halalkalibacillus sediminis]